MRTANGVAGLLVLAASVGAAQAEPGSFFKNMFGGGGAGSGGSDGTPTISGLPRAYDPDDAYCPTVVVTEGGSALPSYAGAAGDNSRLRYQITLGRMSRECSPRPDGSVVVKVGVELRALLGPAGAAGRFDAPLTIAIKYGEKTVVTRSRKVPIAVPAGAAQGMASVIEDGLTVPAAMADAFDIEVGLGNGRPKDPARTAVKRQKPTSEEAVAGASEAPVAGQ